MSHETQHPMDSRNKRASELRYRTDQRSRAAHAQHVRANSAMQPQRRPAADTASPYATRQGSAGKTFLFGFLGALVACAIAFGGFIAWQNFSGAGASDAKESASIPSDESESGIALGSQNPTIVDEGAGSITLAEAVAAKATPSVGCIYVYSAQPNYYNYYYGASDNGGSGELTQSSLGSGIVLTEDGYILTNYHVIENSDALKVNIEGVEYDAEIVGTDPSSDLAVVKAQGASGLAAADIGDSDDLTVGEWVMTVGSPFGLESSVATGVVSATSRSSIMESDSNYLYGYAGSSEPTLYPNMIQTDAAINPGNSGGALVDADGKVIGVNTLITSYSGNYSGVGFAIPINYAINIADQIIAGKTPTHAKMGVSISTVNSSVAKRYNLPVDAGAYVTEIVAGSGAEEAGMKVGDIVTAMDGTTVKTSTDLSLAIRAHEPGATVPVTVNRNGEQIELEVTLGSDEEDLMAQQQQQPQQPQQGGQLGGRGLTYEELLELLNSL